MGIPPPPPKKLKKNILDGASKCKAGQAEGEVFFEVIGNGS